MLTLGSVEAWGWTFNCPYLYYNNSDGWSKVMMLMYYKNGNGDTDKATQGFAFTQIPNTNLWFCKANENRGTELSGYVWGIADATGGDYAWKKESDEGWDARWGWLTSNCNDHYAGTSQENLGYNTYYITSSGHTLTIEKKADDGNWCENTLPEYSAYLKVKKSEDGGSSYPTTITSGPWPGSITLQGTKIKRNGDKHSDLTPNGSRTGDEAASATTSGSQATYNNNIVTGLVTMTLNSVTDDAYEFAGWGTGSTPTQSGNTYEYHITANTTYYAFFKRKRFAVTFAPKGTYGTSTVSATISSTGLTSGNSYNYGNRVTFTATPATGYKIEGWYSDAGCTASLSNGTNTTYTVASLTAAANVYVKFIPKQSTLTLDYQNTSGGWESNGSISNAGSLTGTYDSAMPTLTGTMPSARNGWAFMGFYSEPNGGGTMYYNANGTSARNWDKDQDGGTVTLYAHYAKAEVTSVTFDNDIVNPSTTVTVTANISPTPTGSTHVCWRLLRPNGNETDHQPSFANGGSGNVATFTAPENPGSYKVEAKLYTGAGSPHSDSDELLSVQTGTFQVAGPHTITVEYKCGDEVIAPSVSMSGKPLEWTAVEAPDDIFGYSFSEWEAGDGITLESSVGTRANQFKASYDGGKLTAKYTKIDYIYFKNTLGWSGVHVYFYTSDKYWDNTTYGSGSQKEKIFDGTKPHYDEKRGSLTQIEGTDIWYFDAGAIGCADWTHIVFNANRQDNYEWFEKTELVRRGDYKKGTPLFIPADKTEYNPNEKNVSGKTAKYYNQGYWVNYLGARTGYALEIYKDDGSTLIKTIDFQSEDKRMPMEITTDLEADHIYKFCVKRDGNVNGDVYYGNTGTMNFSNHGQSTPWAFTNYPGKCTLQTTASGNYTFHLTYAKSESSGHDLRIAIEYPIADGDYRLVYTDDTRTAASKGGKPSAIVSKAAGGRDTVSFFVRHDKNPRLYIQKSTVASDGTITWSEYPTPGSATNKITGSIASALSATGVYNFNLVMDGSGGLSVASAESYTGNYYIRTDAANNKWDNYRATDHMMTYSEYSKTHSDYTHYWMAHVGNSTNVKCVVANDYSPCISDTLIQSDHRGGDDNHVDGNGEIQAEANIRFMWNQDENNVYRAYLAPAKNDGSKFLVLSGQANELLDENGNALQEDKEKEQAGYNHKAPDNSVQFVDNENWIYETTVQVVPSSYVKLYASFHNATFYYKGAAGDFSSANAIQLITGTGGAQKVRVIYDFKTDRLVCAMLPSGNVTVATPINADVMFIREHQGDIDQLTFSSGGNLSSIKTAYGVMRFNKWTLNNKSAVNTGTKEVPVHAPLGAPLSIYERSMYFVSFPFKVNLEEVFGFGQYGVHWIVQRYRGDLRAEKGFWAESDSFWEFIWDRRGVTLEPYEGYLLTLDMDQLGESSSVWANDNERAELFFPSSGTMPTISSASVTCTIPAHKCTIDRSSEGLPDTGDPSTSYNRTIYDSHWNVIGVPTYVNTTGSNFAQNTWITVSDSCPNFLYTWNADDNTLTAVDGDGYNYHAMNAYIVQYYGTITWAANSGSPYVARKTYSGKPKKISLRLELQQNEKVLDQTFVKLSEDEEVSADFQFGEDLCKEFYNKPAIYTKIDEVAAAGNTLPMSDQVTTVPVGVSRITAGEYTFSIPEGTEGVGVVLVDKETNTRTNLGLTDYSAYLEEGTHEGRFEIEISPISQVATDLTPTLSQGEGEKARKVLIDGVLYIVRDGKVYDATGRMKSEK